MLRPVRQRQLTVYQIRNKAGEIRLLICDWTGDRVESLLESRGDGFEIDTEMPLAHALGGYPVEILR